jgi:hypothetical protein
VPDDIFTEPATTLPDAPSRRARPGYEQPFMEVIP